MILVTGASGYVGGAAVRRLSAIGCPVAAMARDARKAEDNLPAGVPIRIADYDRSSLERAFAGVGGLLFVASDGEVHNMMRHQPNVIDAAAACGIGHVAFTSIVDVDETSPFYFAPVYRDAERRLAALGSSCTLLRCGPSARISSSRVSLRLQDPPDGSQCPPDRLASRLFRETMWHRRPPPPSPRPITAAARTN